MDFLSLHERPECYIKESRKKTELGLYWSSILVHFGMLGLVVEKANPNY